MPIHIGWRDIALRLLLTVVAGTLIGMNRGGHGRPAGLRTMLLVGLAAAVTMIQVNLLLPVNGKAPDSFVVMDLMRLPLGILTGMGFIGAGAVLRKENMITGVTTAATLWFMTVIGLCFGGGQLGLGLVALALGLVVLGLLKPVEGWWKQDQEARLSIVVGVPGPSEQDIMEFLAGTGYKISPVSIIHQKGEGRREMNFLVQWRSKSSEVSPPAFVSELANRDHTIKVAWQR